VNLLTLLDLKNSRVPSISGYCGDSAQFLDIANKAIRMLMNRGQFQGTVVTLRMCVESGCVVWPREIETILAINVCGAPILNKNPWFQFLVNNGGNVSPDRYCGAAVMQQDNPSPVYRPIFCDHPSYVRVFVERDADVGKVVTFYGPDEYGNEARTERTDGSYLPGISMALAKPYVQTPIRFRAITRGQKELTAGMVNVYYTESGEGDDLIQAARYAPRETNPSYRTSSINTLNAYLKRAGGGQCSRGVEALALIGFYELWQDDEILPIQNIDAIEKMVQSIKFADAYEVDPARSWEADAVRELNLQLNNTQPKQQISVKFTGFGSATPVRRRIGIMI
jgi:hypothetical protein